MSPDTSHAVTAAAKPQNEAGFAQKTLIILISFGLVILVAVGTAIYFYVQYQSTQAQLKSPTSAADAESAQLIAEVGKLIELPKGEQPTVATVSDINKLRGQSFFANAKNGDKVLIYTKAQKAILYDPAEKKIVEVGPINLSQTTQSPTASASATANASTTPEPVSVALYNGTAIVGYTTTVGKQLQTAMPNVTITARQNAAKTTYTKTIVVDLSGKQKAAAAQIAKTLGGAVGSLPTGEQKPAGVDLLVILGK